MIALRDVTKEFGGPLARLRGETVRALDGVSLEIPPGAAVGIVGPNGAGKSTLIRLLLGYIRPTRGSVRIAGEAPREYAERHGIGYVPERVAVPPGWTVRGALEAFAALGEVDEPHARIQEMLERLGLSEVAGRRVGALSKGNLQRLTIAQALLGERRVLILDEATDALDPEWVARVRTRVAEWRRGDPERILLFASHDLDEVERVADTVVVLREGRVRETIDVPAEAHSETAFRLEVEGDDEVEERVRALFPDALAVPGAAHAFRVEAPGAEEMSRRLRALLEAGGVVRRVEPERFSLRERYRRDGEVG